MQVFDAAIEKARLFAAVDEDRAIEQGFNTWLAFIGRGDVLGMTMLTAIVTTLYLAWERGREKR